MGYYQSRFHHQLTFISPSLRYLITFTLLITIPTVWYFFVYLPIEQKINYFKSQSSVLHQQKQTLPQLHQQVDQLEKKKNLLFKQHELSCVQSQELHAKGGLLVFVNKAKESGLALDSCTSNQQQCSQSGTEQPVTLSFDGSLEDVQKFLDSLITTDSFCSCSQLQLHKTKDDQFHVTCSLLSCCFVSEEKALQLKEAEGLGG